MVKANKQYQVPQGKANAMGIGPQGAGKKPSAPTQLKKGGKVPSAKCKC